MLLQVVLATASIGAASAVTKPTFAQPYPWSRTAVAATGDYIADSYNGVSAGHVFENVTTDRLIDILSSNGNYYVVFAGPEHATSQATLAAIDAQAKADGITKIYHFDPYVDGYQLDITNTDASSVASWTGGTSVNYGGTAKVSQIWQLLTDRLPASAVAPGGALADFKGDETLLVSINTTDRANVETGKVITGSYKLKPSDLASFDATAARTAVSGVFHHGPAGAVVPSDTRTQYQFFKRLYDASATKFNGSTPTTNAIGSAVTIFSDTDFPGGAGFPLVSVDIKQAYNLLNTPGERVFLFAGQGCHNTQAIIESLALRAKAAGLSEVYVVDFSLDSNVKFGTGVDIDTASNISATGGLWIRNSANAATGTYRFSYLYGELAKYFDPGWNTENTSKKGSSIAYYPNGDLSSQLTTGGPWLPGNTNPNAKRLQVPTIIAYNKDAAQPVTHHWLHRDSVPTTGTETYTEYMLELAWVRHTPIAVAATAPYADGLSRVQFADEAVAALDGVLVPVKNYVAKYSSSPQPIITGTVKPGYTLAADAGVWFPAPSFDHQWYADGVAIGGATASTYQLTNAEVGRVISVKVTGSRVGFPTLARTSKQTPVVVGDFSSAPKPKISGKALIGKTLKVQAGAWSPAPKVSYQWFANGKKINKATKSSFKLTKAQKGKRITVAVTAAKANYVTLVRTSTATAKVKK
jgi:hypothetical protein